MVHEIQRQLPEGVKPDAIFCSVGGGGLAGGVMEGCGAVGWDNGKRGHKRFRESPPHLRTQSLL